MYKRLRIACVSPNAPGTRKVGVVPPFFVPPFSLTICYLFDRLQHPNIAGNLGHVEDDLVACHGYFLWS